MTMVGRSILSTIAVGLAFLLVPAPATAQQEDACDGPRNLTATVQDDGILLAWDAWSPARAYEVYRAEGSGEAMLIGVTSGDNPEDGEIEAHDTSFFDGDVEAGASYTYHVQALGPPPHVSDVCAPVTATAIPVFPTAAAALAAIAVGLAGYVAMRRT